MKRGRLMLWAVAIVAVVGTGVIAIRSGFPAEPSTLGGPASFRRVNPVQYQRSIEDIFGPGIEVPGRFDPPRREDGLLAVGDSRTVVTPSGFEQAEMRAREISAQVFAADRRKQVMPCMPQSPDVFDQACATEFVEKYGRLLYRRPLQPAEVSSVVDLVRFAADGAEDFYKGLETGLARLLASPNFLFRVEQAAPETTGDDVQRLDDYSLATRISFLLWDAPPDEELLDAARRGALRDEDGIEAQVDRLIQSPRFEQGARAFFSDMFGYEQFDGLSKEQSLFPIYSSQLAEDAKEQALRTIVDLLVTHQGDYRDVFTTRKSFLNRNLSALYAVPAEEEIVAGWAPYTFASGDRREGLLTLAAFLMLDPTHEGRSSPTIRGKAVREVFLCQVVPPPPPNVDFKLVQDTQNAQHRTARERLRVHAEVATCAGCHALTDPIGLSLENYNAVGEYRSMENGAPIDASGTFEGKTYKDGIELQRLMRDSPALTACLAKRAYEYGVGRPATTGEREWMAYLRTRFEKDRYAFASLMKTIATSKAFRSVASSERSEALASTSSQ
jgi:hypothetical protein